MEHLQELLERCQNIAEKTEIIVSCYPFTKIEAEKLSRQIGEFIAELRDETKRTKEINLIISWLESQVGCLSFDIDAVSSVEDDTLIGGEKDALEAESEEDSGTFSERSKVQKLTQ